MVRVCVCVQLKCGDPRTSSFGSVSSLEHRTKIESYVARAVADGCEVLCGGKRPTDLPPPFDQGAFFEPTLLGGLAPTHACSVEEIFGPVATVHSFKTEEEVIGYANNTMYGLAGSVWTTNLQRAHRVAREWETGMVWVNCWLHRDLRVPFGGVKASGVGTEGQQSRSRTQLRSERDGAAVHVAHSSCSLALLFAHVRRQAFTRVLLALQEHLHPQRSQARRLGVEELSRLMSPRSSSSSSLLPPLFIVCCSRCARRSRLARLPPSSYMAGASCLTPSFFLAAGLDSTAQDPSHAHGEATESNKQARERESSAAQDEVRSRGNSRERRNECECK